MSLSAKVGAFNTGTAAAGNTVVVSDVGFQPKVIFFWWSGRTETTDTAGRLNHKRGFGCAISTSDRRYTTSLAQDTPTTMVTNKTQGAAACIGITTTADAIDGLMDLQSMDSGGFTLVIDDAFTASYRIHYLALGGADLTNVVGGTFTKAASTLGDQDITNVGFRPDCVIAFTANQSVNNDTVSPDANFFLGAALSKAARATIMGASNDAAGNAQSIAYSTDTEFLTTVNANVTDIDSHADFVDVLSNGFRINWSVSNAQSVVYNYIALRGGSYALGGALTQTDTSTAISARLGFRPRGTFVFSHCKAESAADTFQDDDETSIGAFTSTTERGAQGIVDNDAAATAVVSAAVEHDACYVNMVDSSGALEGLMDVSAVSDTGFDLIMDDADPSQAFFWYLSFGDSPVLPDRPIRQMRYHSNLRR